MLQLVLLLLVVTNASLQAAPKVATLSPFQLNSNTSGVIKREPDYKVATNSIEAVPAIGALVAACAASLAAAGGCAAIAGVAIAAIQWVVGMFDGVRSDDAWITISASETDYADGNALEITWFGTSDVDKDSLGSISRGETDTWREDLGGSLLKDIELRIDETNDICVTNFVFTVGPEVSGVDSKRYIDLPAWVIAYITETPVTPDCIWFGDSEAAIGNFKFRWKKALECYDEYFQDGTANYARCLTWAMYRYDKMTNGRFVRWTYG